MARSKMIRPDFISTITVANILGWSTKRVRRWFERMKIGKKIGSRIYTTPELLRGRFPGVWEDIVNELNLCNDDDDF